MNYTPDLYLVCQKVNGHYQLVPYSEIEKVHEALLIYRRRAEQVKWVVVGTGFKFTCDTLAEALSRKAQNKSDELQIQLLEPKLLPYEGLKVYYTAPISAPTA